jgi:hypothetical protein
MTDVSVDDGAPDHILEEAEKVAEDVSFDNVTVEQIGEIWALIVEDNVSGQIAEKKRIVDDKEELLLQRVSTDDLARRMVNFETGECYFRLLYDRNP